MVELCELIYGVKFLMFELILVKGEDVDFMYRMLKIVIGKVLLWNFNKYFIDSFGK